MATRGKSEAGGADATLAGVQLAQILFSQGFGSRRECAAIVAAGEVQVDGRVVADPHAEFATDNLVLRIGERDWPYRMPALVLLHKPAGTECSRRPRHHPSVLSLLPAPLQRRGVQPVGRLDADTTGVLLLTDDGALIHRLTHPKRHVEKVYDVTTADPIDDAQMAALLGGVVLHDDPRPVRALVCERVAPNALRLTLAEGRYHQVKRMLGAVGNRVERLHRSAFAGVVLPAGLAPGGWCWLTGEPKPASTCDRGPATPADH